MLQHERKPPEKDVVHEPFYKTATIGTTTNVEDIIELLQNKEHVVVVTHVKNSELEIPEKEKVIAHVARVAHDYFLFN